LMFGWIDELIPDIRDDPVPSHIKPNAALVGPVGLGPE
jgi:hypothetical protein